MGVLRYIAQRILTSAQDGSEWLDSSPSCFTPGERAPVMNYTEGWVGHRASFGAVRKRKLSSFLPKIEPRFLNLTYLSLVAVPSGLSRLQLLSSGKEI
jgi:hypothetical protein